MAGLDFLNDFLGAENKRSDDFLRSIFQKPAPEPARKPQVTIEELIRRRVSHVRLDGRVYRIAVTEVELTK